MIFCLQTLKEGAWTIRCEHRGHLPKPNPWQWTITLIGCLSLNSTQAVEERITLLTLPSILVFNVGLAASPNLSPTPSKTLRAVGRTKGHT